MARAKTFGPLENHHPSSAKNHILIRLAYNKGLTDVVITWFPATSDTRGWVLSSKEINWLRLGGCLESAKEKLSSINNPH